MPTTLTPQEFVNKWFGSTSTERQGYQQHVKVKPWQDAFVASFCSSSWV